MGIFFKVTVLFPVSGGGGLLPEDQPISYRLFHVGHSHHIACGIAAAETIIEANCISLLPPPGDLTPVWTGRRVQEQRITTSPSGLAALRWKSTV